jgi:hypothetical protein
MLKKPSSFVLGSKQSSTYPRVRLRLFFACGRAGSLFEHPAVTFNAQEAVIRESLNVNVREHHNPDSYV